MSARFTTLWQDFLLLVARLLVGWLFVDNGWRKLMAMDPFIQSLASRRVPYATFWGWVGALVEFLGGLALMLGFASRYAAVLLILFVIVATAISHRYWEFTEPAARRMQYGQFGKNLALIGGMIALVLTGGGRWSVDGWRRR